MSKSKSLLAELEGMAGRKRRGPDPNPVGSAPTRQETVVADPSDLMVLLFTCPACRVPKRCSARYNPYCSDKCRKKGRPA